MNYCIIMPRLARDDDVSYIFPIGIAYVSASLKATDRNVLTYNMNYKQLSTREILEKLITEYDLDVIASGGLTIQYPELREIFEIAKQIKPEIITWVGGGIITASPIPAMEALEFADYGMIGEGEVTICELAEAMEGKRGIESVNGLIFRDHINESWIITSPREEIQDLDSLPLPDYEGFDYGALIDKANFETNTEHSGTVSFSRSCPFNCTFCFHPSGTKYRKRSLKSILSEVDYLIDNYGISSLYIADELFALRGAELDAFCQEIIRRNLSFSISLRVDMVTVPLIQKLKESGCRIVSFGLESADNRILKSMNKHITVEQIEEALSICYKLDMPFNGNFIFGDEAETVETYQNTLKWWKVHPEYNIKLSQIIVYPGSILYEHAIKKSLIKSEVEFIRDGCPQLNVSNLTDEEFRKMMLDISLAYRKGTIKLRNCKLSYSTAGLVDIESKCPYCNKKNRWKNREVFRPVVKTICEHCGKIVDFFPLDYIDKSLFIKNFKRINKYKVALWGVTGSIESFFEYIPEAWKEPFLIVDSSKHKQGFAIHGHITVSPDTISDKEIDMVVITFTGGASATINYTIQEKYPSVQRVLYLGDFLNPNLDI